MTPNKHNVQSTLTFCWSHWRHYTLHVLFQTAFRVRIITVLTLPFNMTQKKNAKGSNLENRDATISCLWHRCQKQFLNNIQNCWQCELSYCLLKKGTGSAIICQVIKEWFQTVCNTLMWIYGPMKNLLNNPSRIHSTLYTNHITM
jgi:hypothetical protein